ncbi:MAG TPA: hypothetical protein VHZ81_09920 [Galbitalea sp.]|jgi:hypothetical protein|nr:hypothetical protein [Galbitalea sp.]
MKLWSQRQREKSNREREALGEPLWTTKLDARVLNRLDGVWIRAVDEYDERNAEVTRLLRDEGGYELGPRNSYLKPGSIGWLVTTGVPLQDVIDAILAVLPEPYRAGRIQESLGPGSPFPLHSMHRTANTMDREQVAAEFNRIFDEHRIAYRVVEGQVVERSSDELQRTVIEPALRLLIEKKFVAAHDAYMEALKEVTAGKPGDAITDAGTALQETLTALGLKGNALGPLIADAKRKGLFAGADANLTDGIEKFLNWASANRSIAGDAHHYSTAEKDDAWLMIHVVGALIVRLATPANRGPTGKRTK